MKIELAIADTLRTSSFLVAGSVPSDSVRYFALLCGIQYGGSVRFRAVPDGPIYQ